MYIAPDSTYFPGPILELARGGSWGERLGSSGNGPIWFLDAEQKPVSLSSIDKDRPRTVALVSTDPWLSATWQKIAGHRDLPNGWDGYDAPTPKLECLEAAEALAVLFSAKPMKLRPQFAVDSEGRPSFASYTDDFYLHLTVDAGDRLSWYAVARGEESFEDDVQFDGISLPSGLDRLFRPS